MLKRWIAEGATYQEHWSLLAPVRPAVPVAGATKTWARNPIDAFIAQTLTSSGLKPSRPEEPARLLRRVTFDLTGLPPTPEELAAFMRDPSPAAYDRAVDRLLATDASAEQFARQWLDAIRYADTHGIHIDNYRSIWPFRDWVVGAFRQNLPFDQFTIEQMAGDLLPNATLEQKVASGFNRCLPTTSEGGAIAAEYEAIYAKDRVETMSTVWLGLTTGCAACHDHKFDPVSTKDFYALTAFFRNNTMPAMDGNVADTKPNLFVPAVADRARWTVIQGGIESLRAEQKTRAMAADADFAKWLATAKSLAVPPKDYDVALHAPLVGPALVAAPSAENGVATSGSPTETNARAVVAGPYGAATRIDGRSVTLGAGIPLRREESDSIALLVRIVGTPSGPLVSALDAGERGAGWEVFLDKGKIGVRLRGGRPDFSPSGTAAAVLAPGEYVALHAPLVGPALVAAPSAENAGPTTGSPSENNARAAVAGPYGAATRIDGRSVTLGAGIPLRREESDSIALLVRIVGTPSGPLVSALDAGERGAGWEVFLDKGKIGVRLRGGRPDFSPSGTAAAVLAPGEWHHVLFTFDSGAWSNRSVDVYVDGKVGANAGNINHVPADLVPTAPLTLGARPDAPLAGGEVWVQDVRHYRRGFTVAQAKPLSSVIETYAALTTEASARTPAHTKLLREHFLAAVDAPSLAIAATLDRQLAEDATLRKRGGISLVMEEKKDSEAFAHVLTRGEYSQLGDKVSATTPAVLPPLPADAPRNRLSLARWLVDSQNPLTARVTVNRVWQGFFGTGLVESAGDFGVTGSQPSHPALLDWLAVEFREGGWNYRQLVRLIVTSATYRQSAVVSPALLERDPANRLLARGPRFRLEAEQLRDQALAASGLLVAKVGGRPVRPYQPQGIWEDVAMKESTTRFYRTDSGENLYRRSLYTLIKRTALAPAMDILNAPNREVSCVRRDRTNTPLQALVTLNDPLFVEASRQLAARAVDAAPAFDARLDLVSLRLLGRTFSRTERGIVRRTLDEALTTYRRDPSAAKQLLAIGDSPVHEKIPAPELAAWTLVASQVMNLDESLTK